MPLLRHIRHAAALNAAALIFCAANLHAAWNLNFPFYHGDQPPVSPAPVISAPTVQAPVEVPAAVPEIPKGPASESSSPPPPVIVLPERIVRQPELPAASPPAAESVLPHRSPAPFDGAQRLPATVFTEDILWQGRVQLDGWITIAPQATLTLAPGTIVRVVAGSGINVFGRIVARGTSEEPVLISSLNSEPLAGDWRGIILTGSEKKNLLENLHIEGAETGLLARYSSFAARGVTIRHAGTGLHLQECVAGMTDSLISHAATGVVADNSELTLDAVRIESNRTGITLNSSALVATDTSLAGNATVGLGVDDSRIRLDRFTVRGSHTGARISRCEGTVSDSAFRDNTEAGAILSGSRLRVSGNRFSGNRIGLQVDDHLPALWNNALFNNLGYNLLYMGEESYFAGGNWFGSGEREAVARSLFCRRDGALRAEPFLAKNPVDGD